MRRGGHWPRLNEEHIVGRPAAEPRDDTAPMSPRGGYGVFSRDRARHSPHLAQTTAKLALGEPSAGLDRGHARDDVGARVEIVRLPEGDDFVVGTGEFDSVQDVARILFHLPGFDWKACVEEHRARMVARGGP